MSTCSSSKINVGFHEFERVKKHEIDLFFDRLSKPKGSWKKGEYLKTRKAKHKIDLQQTGAIKISFRSLQDMVDKLSDTGSNDNSTQSSQRRLRKVRFLSVIEEK